MVEAPRKYLKSSEVYDCFLTDFDSGKKYALCGLTAILKSVYPNVNTRKKYHPLRPYHRFEGLTWKTDEKEDKQFTFEEIEFEARKFGFVHVAEDQCNLCFIKFLNIACEGNRVTKEVRILQNNEWQIKISGKIVSLNDLSLTQYPKCKQSLYYCFSNIAKMEICQGIKKKGHMVEKGKVLSWTKNGTHQIYIRSSSCKGFISLTARNANICSTCNRMSKECRKEENKSGQRKCKTDDHNYIKLSPMKRTLSDDKDIVQSKVILLEEFEITDICESSDDDNDDDPDYSPTPQVNSVQFHNASTTDDKVSAIITMFPDLGLIENFKVLLKGQLLNSGVKDKRRNRWSDESFLQECLSIWARSPNAYKQLRNSGLMILPSIRTLTLYKNSNEQRCGVQDFMLDWMLKEAQRLEIPKHGYCGGLMFDEMSLQPDLQFYSKTALSKLVSFIDLGSEGNSIYRLRNKEMKLATHVIQFFFLGDTGFRFPIAHYPTNECVAGDLYVMFWEVVSALTKTGFTVLYSAMDGSSNNRAFLKMHFTGDPSKEGYATQNVHCPSQKLVFIMDPSHEIKKLRNSLLNFKKQIKIKGMLVQWHHWISSYNWDSENHGMKIYQKATKEHLFLDSRSKMRNHLANGVLNSQMLNLMKTYAEKTERKDMGGSILLLENTSLLVANFTDLRPIRTVDDDRLLDNQKVLEFFRDCGDAEGTNFRTNFITKEAYEDVLSMLIGFHQLVEMKLALFPGSYIVPGRVNTDVVENFFCSQRGINGSNNNPTYLQYCKGVSTILLSRKLISTRSNAGGNITVGGAVPYKLHAKKSFRALQSQNK